MIKINLKKQCTHPIDKVIQGPDIPRTYGSYKSEVCECGSWRKKDHLDNGFVGEWTNSPISDELIEDDEL